MAFRAGLAWHGGGVRNPQTVKQTSAGFRGAFQTPGNLSVPVVRIRTAFQTKETVRGTLTRDRSWAFDGSYRWDGTKQFNAGITKEEL